MSGCAAYRGGGGMAEDWGISGRDGLTYWHLVDSGWVVAKNCRAHGSAAACTSRARASAERFIHIEQSRDVRAQMAQVAAVFDATVP